MAWAPIMSLLVLFSASGGNAQMGPRDNGQICGVWMDFQLWRGIVDGKIQRVNIIKKLPTEDKQECVQECYDTPGCTKVDIKEGCTLYDFPSETWAVTSFPKSPMAYRLCPGEGSRAPSIPAPQPQTLPPPLPPPPAPAPLVLPPPVPSIPPATPPAILPSSTLPTAPPPVSRQPPSACTNKEIGIAHPGHTMDVTSPLSVEGCERDCQARVACRGYVMVEGKCFLKTEMGRRIYFEGAVSGYMC